MTIGDVAPFAGRRCAVHVRDPQLGGGLEVTGIVAILNATKITVTPVSPLGGSAAPFGDGTFPIAHISTITPV